MRRTLTITARVTAVIAVLLFLSWLFCPTPELKHYVPYSKAYLDSSGQLLQLTLAQDERYRIYTPLAKISPEFVEATLLYEDQHFYQHPGVDFPALARAFYATYIDRHRRVGASTITMQVARLRWGIASNTGLGKVEQIVRALQLSRHYSKQEILEAYLNLAPYGGNIEGIGAASLIYFGKPAAQLNLVEALTLAVVPQNPNQRAPTKKNQQPLLAARERLWQRWQEQHPESVARAKYFQLPLAVTGPQALPFKAPHFINYLQSQLPYWDSGLITTTLNLGQQQKLGQVLADYVVAKGNSGIHNASALLINYQTMAIEAMVGSADFFNNAIQGQVNGTTAKRSPGSALKPFVYALAMDEGLIHPESLLKDAPRQYGGFTPENYDKQFLGPISARRALIESRNVPAVTLQAELQNRSFYQLLHDAGVEGLQPAEHYGLALALGGGEVTALELAGLYAMLANGGDYSQPRLLANAERAPARRLLSREASYLTLDILKDNPAPGSLAIDSERAHNQVAWKTGTSWAFRDAWAVGVSGPYVLAVWVGNFDGSGNQSFIGRTAAGPLLFKLFNALQPGPGWQVSDAFNMSGLNIKQLQVCADTGDLYQKYCPQAKSAWFIPGVSPIKLSNIYRPVAINPKTGKRACWQSSEASELKVYAFWPSDLVAIFNQAGISFQAPPPFDSDCQLDQTSAGGQAPIIVSPRPSLDYIVRLSDEQPTAIPLTATVDGDVEQVHWFIDDAYFGSGKKNETLFWQGQPGSYQITVVDDLGRSASHKVQLKADR
ncbi:penicillin-binding protein 1C [Halioxenophilus sp. WMMB6]|uniref:penicillin-binding protein 1C n=1 Tax=Halioxenophilus sp. WMMB6 TaxID=3073815 RepID=UPI00295E25CC|nr:penicillin-binding protein 1C [Halioxenophilus sp. WMMB6]